MKIVTTIMGNTSTSYKYINRSGTDNWVNYLVTNVSTGSILINLYIAGVSAETRVIPKNLELLAGETFEIKEVVLPILNSFRLTTNGSTDYYIVMYEDNTN